MKVFNNIIDLAKVLDMLYEIFKLVDAYERNL